MDRARASIRAALIFALLTCTAGAEEPEILFEQITPPGNGMYVMYIWNAGDDRLFILERQGRIRIWTKDEGILDTPFLDISDKVGSSSERGLYAVAFHPDYATNGHFFVSYYEVNTEIVVVNRYQVSGDPNIGDESSELRVFEVPQPGHIHNGGQILFGPDGYLWMGFGDGNNGDADCRVQGNDHFLGKIVRIDVDAIQAGVPFSYGIPPDNPHLAASDPTDEIPDEIYARGFRHPWRFSIDFPTGDVWIGEVGASSWEEVNRIPGGIGGGQNFGWKIMEGPVCRTDPVPSNCPPGTPPCFSPEYETAVWSYSHGTTMGGTELRGCAVIGGFVYRGAAIPELQGRYVFTDHCTSRIRTLEETSPGVWGNPKEIADSPSGIISFGLDADGELYVGNQTNAYKIVGAAGRNEQNSSQQACIREMNKGAADIARQRMRANTECVKFAGRDQLSRLDGVPETGATVAGCFETGLPKRIDKALDRLNVRETKRCRPPGQTGTVPDFGYTSPAAVTTAALNAATRLTEAVLGPDPDAAIVLQTSDLAGARCQERVMAGMQSLFHTIWRRAADGKVRSLRGRLGSPSREADDLRDHVLGYVDSDDRRIPSKVESIESHATRFCDDAEIATLLPGDCSGSGDAASLATCLHERSRCHFCRQFEASDALTIDCDDWDDGAVNGSCPSEAEITCGEPGTGVNWAATDVNCNRLQDYRLFSDPTDPTTSPEAGGLPFDLTTPLFSDYTQKYRFVFIPPGEQAQYDGDAPFSFPVGTIIAKTFSFAHDLRTPGLGEDVIETRLLIRRDLGWEGLPYVWDETTGEATLALDGGSYDASWIHFDGSTRTTEYQIPTATQCGDCHVSADVAGDAPIGPKARLLNDDHPYAGGTANQLDHWAAQGILAGAPPSASAPRLPVWDDALDGTEEERARAYLETNCAHCHGPGGKAEFTGLDLAHDRPLDEAYGVCQVSGFEGAPGLTLNVVPGDPDDSIAIFRMESTAEDVKMPELARSVVHEEGAALVRSFILGLPGSCP